MIEKSTEHIKRLLLFCQGFLFPLKITINDNNKKNKKIGISLQQ